MSAWSFRKEFLVHTTVTAIFLLLIIGVRFYFTDTKFFLPFAIGGLLGMFLPDIDHLIYALYLRPQELTSMRVSQKLKGRALLPAVQLLYSTKDERINLIFHNTLFQCIFAVFAFLVVTSSGSLLGKGLVLSFLLHLVIDQFVDLRVRGDVTRWFQRPLVNFPDPVTRKWFIYGNALLVLILGLLF